MAGWRFDTDTLGKNRYFSLKLFQCQHFYGHAQAGRAQQGYTASQACIALDKTTNTLRVMLQAKDASGVEYRNLSRVDQKRFDGARNKEMQGLPDLGAYRLMSLAESLAFWRDHPDYVLTSRWVE
eukprot:7134081-Karenia_brevis.AAC.1